MDTRDIRLSIEQLTTIYNSLISQPNFETNESLIEITDMIQITIKESDQNTLNDFTA